MSAANLVGCSLDGCPRRASAGYRGSTSPGPIPSPRCTAKQRTQVTITRMAYMQLSYTNIWTVSAMQVSTGSCGSSSGGRSLKGTKGEWLL